MTGVQTGPAGNATVQIDPVGLFFLADYDLGRTSHLTGPATGTEILVYPRPKKALTTTGSAEAIFLVLLVFSREVAQGREKWVRRALTEPAEGRFGEVDAQLGKF
jgi:hypothetical protein